MAGLDVLEAVKLWNAQMLEFVANNMEVLWFAVSSRALTCRSFDHRVEVAISWSYLALADCFLSNNVFSISRSKFEGLCS